MTELEEEHGGEDGLFAELDKVNKANVTARLKEIRDDKDAADEAAVLNAWQNLNDRQSTLNRSIKEDEADLDAKPTTNIRPFLRLMSRLWLWTISGSERSMPPFMAKWIELSKRSPSG